MKPYMSKHSHEKLLNVIQHQVLVSCKLASQSHPQTTCCVLWPIVYNFVGSELIHVSWISIGKYRGATDIAHNKQVSIFIKRSAHLGEILKDTSRTWILGGTRPTYLFRKHESRAISQKSLARKHFGWYRAHACFRVDHPRSRTSWDVSSECKAQELLT